MREVIHTVMQEVLKAEMDETLFDRSQDYTPRFAATPSGCIDPRPWRQGFYAAINLNIKRWNGCST